MTRNSVSVLFTYSEKLAQTRSILYSTPPLYYPYIAVSDTLICYDNTCLSFFISSHITSPYLLKIVYGFENFESILGF